ncbi:MAG: DUF2917 domain-containing protein [Rhodocyclaceae bacterium]|nr:DUF2917 domain-containing protein [Rhodocyclaceae bacterium]
MSSAACATPERCRRACGTLRGFWTGFAAALENLWRRGRAAIGADPIELVLRPNRPLRLSAARGRRILCTGGCAWITAPGLRDDVFLHDGQAWEIAGNGLVLVEAVGSATVALTRSRGLVSANACRGKSDICRQPGLAHRLPLKP